jgi:transcription factor C subunit 7
MGLKALEKTVVKSSRFGESIQQLHDRIAYALFRIIERADRNGETSIIICTHAAAMIAMGRALTGKMPEDVSEEDFHCYTASLSRYNRRKKDEQIIEDVNVWHPEKEDVIPRVRWKGEGVAGGWDCVLNGDCSFLTGGEERGWRFSGDESFLTSLDSFYDGTPGGGEQKDGEKGDAAGKESKL